MSAPTLPFLSRQSAPPLQTAFVQDDSPRFNELSDFIPVTRHLFSSCVQAMSTGVDDILTDACSILRRGKASDCDDFSPRLSDITSVSDFVAMARYDVVTHVGVVMTNIRELYKVVPSSRASRWRMRQRS
ncbi:unnamed protein product [Symbiodinium microadriaticum]|nr:unnamed protein product [Symbiodinium microadriaticum]